MDLNWSFCYNITAHAVPIAGIDFDEKDLKEVSLEEAIGLLVRKLNLTEKRLRYILVLVKHNPCYDW